ncbi:hypothetical protein HMI56_004601 [Coelomomyces lativittatus]|nr:hypothetical protein HMI56_004601 [Coelomomyces lativittatus]
MARHTNPKSYSCSSCSLTFKTFLGLFQHQQRYHESRPRMVCDKCDRQFVSKINYQRHICYVCSICDKRFSKKSNYQTHCHLVHQRKREFKCTTCSLMFQTRQHLQRHQQQQHFQVQPSSTSTSAYTLSPTYTDTSNPNVLILSLTGFNPQRRFACSQCSRQFSRQYDLNRHVHACHHLKHHHLLGHATSIASGYLETYSLDQQV